MLRVKAKTNTKTKAIIAVSRICAYSAKTEHSLRMSGALFR